MKASGCRERTIYDYGTITSYFIRDTNVEYLNDITSEVLYIWLEKMNVKNTTKLTRLKCFKAFLSRCYNNGWFKNRFWTNVKVKVDAVIKEGATDEDVDLLLSLLDYTRFTDLRNATAILLMYKCGLRVGTIGKMKESHIDFDNKLLRLDGEVMKNHKGLILPLNDQLIYLLSVLIKHNALIRSEYKQVNENLFITMKGKHVNSSITTNLIQKQLREYAKRYGIKNINPHALRRGFATKLYNKSNDLLLVSKALGHTDLSVTTKYLHTELNDVAMKVKEFM